MKQEDATVVSTTSCVIHSVRTVTRSRCMADSTRFVLPIHKFYKPEIFSCMLMHNIRVYMSVCIIDNRMYKYLDSSPHINQPYKILPPEVKSARHL